MTSVNALASASSGVMSRNRTPGRGKSGTLRMSCLISCGVTASPYNQDGLNTNYVSIQENMMRAASNILVVASLAFGTALLSMNDYTWATDSPDASNSETFKRAKYSNIRVVAFEKRLNGLTRRNKSLSASINKIAKDNAISKEVDDQIRDSERFIVGLFMGGLGLAAAALGLFGYSGYRSLYESIQNRADQATTKLIDEHAYEIRIRVYLQLSVIYFKEYSRLDLGEEKRLDLIDLAIELVEVAQEGLKKIDSPKYNWLRCRVNNHHGYHLAIRDLTAKNRPGKRTLARGNSKDKDKALCIGRLLAHNAEELLQASASERANYPLRYELLETVAIIQYCFGDDGEKERACKKVGELLRDESIDRSWRRRAHGNNERLGMPLPSLADLHLTDVL